MSRCWNGRRLKLHIVSSVARPGRSVSAAVSTIWALSATASHVNRTAESRSSMMSDANNSESIFSWLLPFGRFDWQQRRLDNAKQRHSRAEAAVLEQMLDEVVWHLDSCTENDLSILLESLARGNSPASRPHIVCAVLRESLARLWRFPPHDLALLLNAAANIAEYDGLHEEHDDHIEDDITGEISRIAREAARWTTPRLGLYSTPHLALLSSALSRLATDSSNTSLNSTWRAFGRALTEQMVKRAGQFSRRQLVDVCAAMDRFGVMDADLAARVPDPILHTAAESVHLF